MPLIINGNEMHARWAGGDRDKPLKSTPDDAKCLNIALINNMPDLALQDTELQFSELLDAAAGDIPVRLKFYSLSAIARSDEAKKHLNGWYSDVHELWGERFDGVIITGTEPRRPDLREEPYWAALVEVLDWAERNTASTVLSCLAAHAAVLHSDGIVRHALKDKRFGVFDEQRVGDHVLTQDAGNELPFPHSRWNELREHELTSAGYTVLTKSDEAGVNLFVKQKKESLFVHFQGHPEYGVRTLLKEYRRDVGRFLRRERATYPPMPKGYFDVISTQALNEFQETALTHPRKELLAAFPEVAGVHALKFRWRPAAVCLYRNWLQYVASRRTDSSTLARAPRTVR